MLARSRGLLAIVRASSSYSLPAGCSDRPWSSSTHDVAEANQELNDFFGISTAGSRTPSAPPQHDPDDLLPHLSPHRSAPSANSSSSSSRPWEPSAALDTEGQRRLTHIDASGSAAMVDVSQKSVTIREAQASCVVSLRDAYTAVAANAVAKGDVLKVAQLAGIMGAKATAALIPLCHNIPISKVDVQLQLDEPSRSVLVRALAVTDGKTGVEMEALTAASVAALTVYDMCKAAAKDMVVGALQLDYKSGGRSGTYLRAGLRRADLLPSARPPL